jgi:hypothetical protein
VSCFGGGMPVRRTRGRSLRRYCFLIRCVGRRCIGREEEEGQEEEESRFDCACI